MIPASGSDRKAGQQKRPAPWTGWAVFMDMGKMGTERRELLKISTKGDFGRNFSKFKKFDEIFCLQGQNGGNGRGRKSGVHRKFTKFSHKNVENPIAFCGSLCNNVCAWMLMPGILPTLFSFEREKDQQKRELYQRIAV